MTADFITVVQDVNAKFTVLVDQLISVVDGADQVSYGFVCKSSYSVSRKVETE